MSYKGVVEARCPEGCEPFEAEVWSVIRGDKDPEIAERLLAGEINLLACPACEKVFYYEHPLIYIDTAREIMAFIFPEAYAKEEKRWRAQMAEDFEKFQAGLKVRKLYDPVLYFGVEPFIAVMRAEEAVYEEAEVAAVVAQEAGLELYDVNSSYAREKGLPPVLPLEKGKGPLKERLLHGLRALLKANDALGRYAKVLADMEKAGPKWEIPPTQQ